MTKTDNLTFEEIRYVPGVYQSINYPGHVLLVVKSSIGPLKSRASHNQCCRIIVLEHGVPIVFDEVCGLTRDSARYEKKENLDYKVTLFLKE